MTRMNLNWKVERHVCVRVTIETRKADVIVARALTTLK